MSNAKSKKKQLLKEFKELKNEITFLTRSSKKVISLKTKIL